MSETRARRVTVEEAIERSSVNLPGLELTKTEIALLAAIYVFREVNTDDEVNEDSLADLYWKTCDLMAQPFDQKGMQALIKRFRTMRLISCIEGREMAYGSDISYSLSPLGHAIAECAIGTQVITALSLEIILGKITAEVVTIYDRIKAGLSAEEWETVVAAPFNVHINELFSVISVRQGEMDQRTEEVRDRISRKLGTSWFDAIDECIDMLDIIAANLQEINSVYSKYNFQVTDALYGIIDRALEANQQACRGQAKRILGNFERLTSWSDKKLKGWARYHTSVNSYISDLVRTDPERQRSKQIIAVMQSMIDRPFTLCYAYEPQTYVLRDGLVPEKRAMIQRCVKNDTSALESEKQELLRFVDNAIERCIVNGLVNLVTVGRVLADDLPRETLWKALALIPKRMVPLGSVAKGHEQGWHAVDAFSVENIEVRIGA